jgi:hypothetical protein
MTTATTDKAAAFLLEMRDMEARLTADLEALEATTATSGDLVLMLKDGSMFVGVDPQDRTRCRLHMASADLARAVTYRSRLEAERMRNRWNAAPDAVASPHVKVTAVTETEARRMMADHWLGVRATCREFIAKAEARAAEV